MLKRPHEQPMMESQPARPPSGGMASVFSLTFIVPSGVEGAARDLWGVSAGMMKTVKNRNFMYEE